MKVTQVKTKVFGHDCSLKLMNFDKTDSKEWKKLFDMWLKLKMGMRDYKAREPNFPEGLSEVAFCLYSGSSRLISMNGKASSSFDTFNTQTNRAEQIKATSVDSDLTSFGPKSKWDDIYLLDFYNGGKLDGTFNVYKIPTEFIHEIKVNKGHTFLEQQAEGRRPRFSITKSLIRTGRIKLLAKNVKVW